MLLTTPNPINREKDPLLITICHRRSTSLSIWPTPHWLPRVRALSRKWKSTRNCPPSCVLNCPAFSTGPSRVCESGRLPDCPLVAYNTQLTVTSNSASTGGAARKAHTAVASHRPLKRRDDHQLLAAVDVDVMTVLCCHEPSLKHHSAPGPYPSTFQQLHLAAVQKCPTAS